MATYATAEQVREAAGLDSTALPDSEANRLLGFAEDRIDSLLSDRAVDETSGRRIVPADEDSWRTDKLAVATARLAARFAERPDLIHDDRYSSTGGEISVSGALGEVLGPAVTGPLEASGLLARPTSSVPMRRFDERTTSRTRDPFLDL